MKKTIALTLATLMLAGIQMPAAEVKENWDKHCLKCHGTDGKGDTKMGKKMEVKDYTDAKIQAEMKDDKMFTNIKEGNKDKDGKIRMKPFAEALTDDEIKALIAYVRAFKK